MTHRTLTGFTAYQHKVLARHSPPRTPSSMAGLLPFRFLAGIIALSLGSIWNEREASATPPGTPPGGGTWSTASSSPVEVFPLSENSTEYSANSSAQYQGGQVQTNAHLV